MSEQDPVAHVAGLMERGIDRFRSLLRPDPNRTRVTLPEPPRPPSAGEVLHALLHTWAKQAPPALDEHLVMTIEQTHEAVERARKEHPEANFWLGYERAIRDVRLAFQQWSHPDAGTPTKSALQGGLNAEP